VWPLSIGVLDEFGHLDVASVVISTLFAGFYTFASVATNTVCLGFGDERHLGQSCKIIRRPDRFCRDQEKGATCVGLVFFVPYVCRKCSCNAHNAMCNRHGVERYDSSYAFPHVIRHLARARNVAAGYYGDNLEKIRETWIYRYPYHKRVATLKSAREDAIRANRVKNMVKRETYLKRPKKARCIQFYHNMATQAFVGPEMYCLQKAYTQTLNEWSSADNSGIEITLASGMSAVALGEWMDKVNKKNCPMSITSRAMGSHGMRVWVITTMYLKCGFMIFWMAMLRILLTRVIVFGARVGMATQRWVTWWMVPLNPAITIPP